MTTDEKLIHLLEDMLHEFSEIKLELRKLRYQQLVSTAGDPAEVMTAIDEAVKPVETFTQSRGVPINDSFMRFTRQVPETVRDATRRYFADTLVAEHRAQADQRRQEVAHQPSTTGEGK